MTKYNPIFLDCDTGEDDALAILVAVANKLTLKYVVSSYGNTTIENSTRNSSDLLSLCEAAGVKVIRGTSAPLNKHPYEKEMTAGEFVGKNGICNATLSPSKYKNVIKHPEEIVHDKIIELIKENAQVTYIITGPCTNFAKICQKMGPEIKKYVKDLYIMGGAIYADGNSGPQHPKTGKSSAEFNFYNDPHAAEIVLESGVPVNLITWDITSTVTIPPEKISAFKATSPVGEFIIDLMKCFFKYYGYKYYRNFELNDPITVLALMGYGSYVTKKIEIVKDGMHYGRSVLSPEGVNVNYFEATDQEKLAMVDRIISDLDLVV